jgi:hypothetical protein
MMDCYYINKGVKHKGKQIIKEKNTPLLQLRCDLGHNFVNLLSIKQNSKFINKAQIQFFVFYINY